VKLLFDQNLSPRLVDALAEVFPESMHVQLIGLHSSSDAAVWDVARSEGYVIVTKDVDFTDRSAMFGHPPKVIWIRLGNCTTAEIESSLRAHVRDINAFETDDELGVLALMG
jgi:predicted nuclease of predicted toxin-antitoxin system